MRDRVLHRQPKRKVSFKNPFKKSTKKATSKKTSNKNTKPPVKKTDKKLDKKYYESKKADIQARIDKRTAFNERDQKRLERIDKKLTTK